MCGVVSPCPPTRRPLGGLPAASRRRHRRQRGPPPLSEPTAHAPPRPCPARGRKTASFTPFSAAGPGDEPTALVPPAPPRGPHLALPLPASHHTFASAYSPPWPRTTPAARRCGYAGGEAPAARAPCQHHVWWPCCWRGPRRCSHRVAPVR